MHKDTKFCYSSFDISTFGFKAPPYWPFIHHSWSGLVWKRDSPFDLIIRAQSTANFLCIQPFLNPLFLSVGQNIHLDHLELIAGVKSFLLMSYVIAASEDVQLNK